MSYGESCYVAAVLVRLGSIRLVLVRYGLVRLGGLGIVRCGRARYGWVRFCHGKARRSRNGEVGHGMVLWGVASRGGRGMVRSVKERRVEAVEARSVEAGCVELW